MVICDPFFIRNQLKKCCEVSGFLVQNNRPTDVVSVAFVPHSGYHLRPAVRFDFLEFLPERCTVLFVDRGFVCARSFSIPSLQRLFVANPLNKQYVRITCPHDLPLDCSIAFVEQGFNSPSDIVFKFELVSVSAVYFDPGEVSFVFDTYCSVSQSWQRSVSSYTCPFDGFHGRAVSIGTKVYWLTHRTGLIMFDTDSNLGSVVSWPLPFALYSWCVPEMCIGKIGNNLAYIVISEFGLQVFVLTCTNTPLWDIVFGVTLQDLSNAHPYTLFDLERRVLRLTTAPILEPVGFLNNMIVLRVSGSLYVYHYKTGELRRWGRVRRFKLRRQHMFSNIVMPYFANALLL